MIRYLKSPFEAYVKPHVLEQDLASFRAQARRPSWRERKRLWTPHGQVGRFAGDIKQKYGTITTFTVTNLQSLASSSTFQSGWTSAYVDNTSNVYINSVAYGQITSGTTPTTPCSVRCYAYAYDGTNSLTFTSSGTPGTEGALTITDSEQLDASLVLLWSSDIDGTTNDVYVMPPRSIRQAFGFYPRNWALYVAHNCTAALKSTGNAMYADHEYRQYT